ncbi:hypothetical protein JCM10207_004918 [Rhodosporidiobolus poonsookiae]
MASRLSSKGVQTLRQLQPLRPRLSSSKLTPSSTPARIRLASYIPHLEKPQKKGVKVGHVFMGLALLGVGATSYGLYQFYQSFTAYPDSETHPIRSKLRAALRASTSGEFDRSSSFFQQAYALAQDLFSTGQLADTREVALKRLTGIAVRWGGMWEEAGELAKAVEAYDTGFQPVAALVDGYKNEGWAPASEFEIKRGAAIAMKLGDLWVRLGGAEGDKEAERYYTWAVEELMRLNLTEKQKAQVKTELDAGALVGDAPQQQEKKKTEGAEGAEEEYKLPGWVGEVELVAAFERLGELYSRQGRIEFAQPLLQQAIALLLPPPPRTGPKPPLPPIPQRCHAATLMNNLSSALVAAASPSAKEIEASARWAQNALHVAGSARREADKARGKKEVPLAEMEERECELTAIVSAYNLGKLSEMAKDPVTAEQYFVHSGKLATKHGLRDAVQQSNTAIRRLKHPLASSPA